MYNPEIKQRFIDERYLGKEATKIVALRLFTSTQKFEEKQGCDLCEFSSGEISSVVKSVSRAVRKDSGTRVSVLRQYLKWCVDNNIPNANENAVNFEAPSQEEIMRESLFYSPEHLASFLDKVFDPVESESSDLLLRAYCWLAYSGLSEKDVLGLTKSNFMFDKMTIVYDKRQYVIYPQEVSTLYKICNLNYFNVIHPNYTKRCKRVESDLIFRNIQKVVNKSNFLSNKLAKNISDALKNKRIKHRTNYYRIWLSGIFYEQYKTRELQGFPTTFEWVARAAGSDTNRNINKRRGILESDYKVWKESFKDLM